MTTPIPNCPQSETPIRERAWADGQRPEPKYSVDEARARLGFVISDHEPRILTWESGGCHPASIAECALWDAYAERIEADESAVPAAWQYRYKNDRMQWSRWVEWVPEEHPEAPFPKMIGRWEVEYRKLFIHPPAQAAQGEPVAGIQVPREGLPRVAQFIPYPAWLRLPPGIHGLFTAPPAQPTERVPEGWVLVPREPTKAMLDAAMARDDDEPLTDWGKIIPAPHAEIYKAMLAAAPSAPEGESHE